MGADGGLEDAPVLWVSRFGPRCRDDVRTGAGRSASDRPVDRTTLLSRRPISCAARAVRFAKVEVGLPPTAPDPVPAMRVRVDAARCADHSRRCGGVMVRRVRAEHAHGAGVSGVGEGGWVEVAGARDVLQPVIGGQPGAGRELTVPCSWALPRARSGEVAGSGRGVASAGRARRGRRGRHRGIARALTRPGGRSWGSGSTRRGWRRWRPSPCRSSPGCRRWGPAPHRRRR